MRHEKEARPYGGHNRRGKVLNEKKEYGFINRDDTRENISIYRTAISR